MANKLVILRPHKAASTSLTQAVAANYQRNEVCPSIFMYQFNSVPEQHWQNYRLFSPHFTVEQGRQMFPDATFISIVRNPKKRLLSSYFFWRGQILYRISRFFPHHDISFKAAQMSLKEYLSSDNEVVLRATDNYLTRFFGGGRFGEDVKERTQIYLPEDISMEEMYEKALAALENTVKVTAVAERMTDSLEAINRKLNMNINTTADYRHNITNKAYVDQEIDEECEILLNERLIFDQRLYNHCVDMLEKGISSERPR